MARGFLIGFVVLTFAAAALIPPGRTRAQASSRWTTVTPLPSALGVAGPYAGVSGKALLVGGGANFPGRKPWEGGTKVWHDTLYALERPDGAWAVAGRLPRPLGYGISVVHRESVVCVGGSDALRHYADAFRLSYADTKIVLTELPPLPRAVANACGAIVGDGVIVVGGQERPDSTTALRTAYALDLSVAVGTWRELPAIPGPGRMLAVAAVCDGAIYVAGGASLTGSVDGSAKRTYLTEVVRLRPGQQWERMADLPRPVVAAPSPAPADTSGFWILGGDDGSQVGTAPTAHRGFSRDLLRYDVRADRWTTDGTWSTPRVTVPAVRWFDRWAVPSGEVRPGVRSPVVELFHPTFSR